MGADGGGRKGAATAKAVEGGAGTLLAGLPCRGNFTESNIASSMGGLKVYICLHDTAPPEGQVVKTDTNNILIRALQLTKQKSEANDVGNKTPGESSKGKRNASRSLDSKNPSKRPNTGNSAGSSAHEEPPPNFSQLALQSFTVEKLRSLLKERGLSPKGKKKTGLFWMPILLHPSPFCSSISFVSLPTPLLSLTLSLGNWAAGVEASAGVAWLPGCSTRARPPRLAWQSGLSARGPRSGRARLCVAARAGHARLDGP